MTAIADAATGRPPAPLQRLLQRFLGNRLAVIGLVLLALVGAMIFILPLVMTLDPIRINLGHVLRPPSLQHPFGTDRLGRDVLARVAYGGRVTLVIGLAGVALALLVGAGAGMLSGYVGGLFDTVLMAIVDLLMAFPSMLLAVIVAAILGTGLTVVAVAICVFMIPIFVRLTRATVLSLRQRDYVRAARGMGATHARILRRHILPNCLGIIAVQASLNSASAVLSVAWMSFLGFGARSPTPELGVMISDARGVLFTAPWCSIFPGLTITLTVLALNFIGDGLRDAFDLRDA